MTDKILGTSDGIKFLREQIVRTAQSDSKILILGENGTGKELVAESIHQHSKRRDRNFVALNCAAVPESLLEAEIFGHEKGAFTGAVARRQGVFERADKGTLFLDEIGDMPLTMQAKLLRVLQSGAFERIGGHETIQVDVRVIAATNKNLKQAVHDKTFREDLYHRIAVLPLRVPALRVRTSDIPELVRAFIARSPRPKLQVTPLALVELQKHDWPGNVRQLINIVDRFVALANDDKIGAADVARALALDEYDSVPTTPTYISRDIVPVQILKVPMAPDEPVAPAVAAPVVAEPIVAAPISSPRAPETKSEEPTKHCNGCQLDLPVSAFGKKLNGYQSPCKSCRYGGKKKAPESNTPLALGEKVRLGELIAEVVELTDPDLVGVRFIDGKDDYWAREAVQRA